jgi:hypothetical protein
VKIFVNFGFNLDNRANGFDCRGQFSKGENNGNGGK